MTKCCNSLNLSSDLISDSSRRFVTLSFCTIVSPTPPLFLAESRFTRYIGAYGGQRQNMRKEGGGVTLLWHLRIGYIKSIKNGGARFQISSPMVYMRCRLHQFYYAGSLGRYTFCSWNYNRRQDSRALFYSVPILSRKFSYDCITKISALY